MLEVNLKGRFRLKDNFVLHQIPDLEKYWLFDLASGEQYALNEVGMFALQQLRHGATFEELVYRMLEEYDTGEEEVQEDIAGLLADLLAEGIVFKDQNEYEGGKTNG